MQQKKVLIISYYWPPSGGSGVQRWLKIVKYLNLYGWDPIIYTPENPEFPEIDNSLLAEIPVNTKVIKQPIWEPYHLYKKWVGLKKDDKIGAGFMSEKKKIGFTETIAVWLRGNLFIPDARKFWIKPSVKYLRTLLKEENISAIISSGPPHSMHLIAIKISRLSGLPWLADFADPWTSIDFYDQLHLTKFADQRHKMLEKRVLNSASKVSVVTKTMAEEFKLIIPREYEIITNGFDESDISQLKNITPDLKFSISHIGSLVPSRNPQILWDALSKMVKEDSGFEENLEIKLVGKIDHSVIDSISKAGLLKYLRKINYLPHDKALIETKKSQLLLLLINQTPNAKGILTGKLFEYLAVERPILCIGPSDGDIADILKDTQSGKICDFDDESTLRIHLESYYQDYLDKKDFPGSSNLGHYTWKNLAKTMASTMNHMVESK
ncbi:MAG: glycosyl transferase family 1 [Bacteroidales bacterium]|nr:glycosyl transferase family 1 [Bacteroidales bacterium]